jgi:hypothetical protein
MTVQADVQVIQGERAPVRVTSCGRHHCDVIASFRRSQRMEVLQDFVVSIHFVLLLDRRDFCLTIL